MNAEMPSKNRPQESHFPEHHDRAVSTLRRPLWRCQQPPIRISSPDRTSALNVTTSYPRRNRTLPRSPLLECDRHGIRHLAINNSHDLYFSVANRPGNRSDY